MLFLKARGRYKEWSSCTSKHSLVYKVNFPVIFHQKQKTKNFNE